VKPSASHGTQKGAIFMSNSKSDASVQRALDESRTDTEYATPYSIVSQSLRVQPAKTRAEVVALLMKEFGLHEFDAETVCRSAADLSQLREATRLVRKRRYGQLEITYIEFDVVTWRILPSIENVRFEGDRAWNPSAAARYSSLGSGQPVLTLSAPEPARLLSELRAQTAQIWRTNPHSRSIPMRGIETSGLMSIARIKLGDSGYVGVLDATDGFSRTVGAQRGSGVDVGDVLGELQGDGLEHRLRTELIAMRDNGTADLDSEAGQISAARLRCSVMPRAQVIVGYAWLDEEIASAREGGFDGARRQLVGHIHLEPPLKFTDSTQFALKARIALHSLRDLHLLPKLPGHTPDELLDLLVDGATADSGRHEADSLLPDEIMLLAIDAIRGPSGPDERVVAVNKAIYSLTGKKPGRQDRTIVAVDTAMRANRLIAGATEADSDFVGRRSTLGRAFAHSSFNSSRLSRRTPAELLAKALADLAANSEFSERATRDAKVSAAAAELGALALYALVEGVGDRDPLIIRSGTKAADGSYLPEPPEIMAKLMTSKAGLNQLAQVVFDSRAGRRLISLSDGMVAEDDVNLSADTLESKHLIAYARGGKWNADSDAELDPRAQLDVVLSEIKLRASELALAVAAAAEVESLTGFSLVEAEGAPMSDEYVRLEDVVFELRKWTERDEQNKSDAADAHEADSGYESDEAADAV
jgi:hypothetical protein